MTIDETRSKLSLVMMARNAESTILRTLENVEDYVSEFVLVDNMCDDKTVAIATAWADKIKASRPFDFRVLPFNPATHPHAFVQDSRSTFEQAPWVDKTEYSDLPLLVAWDEMRNFTARAATKKYILMLDADDLFTTPSLIRGAVELMEKHRRDVMLTTYQLMIPDTDFVFCDLKCWRFLEGEAIRSQKLRWEGATHELLTGEERVGLVPNMTVRDMRDNKGSGARVPNRAIKILWLDYQKRKVKTSARCFYYLGAESSSFDPQFSRWAFREYLARGRDPLERSSACIYLAESFEGDNDLDTAISWVHRALENEETPDGLFVMGRLLYRKANLVDGYTTERSKLLTQAMDKCIEGFELLDCVRHSINTRSPVYERGSYILLAEGLTALGRHDEAISWAKRGLETFPDVDFLKSYLVTDWSL